MKYYAVCIILFWAAAQGAGLDEIMSLPDGKDKFRSLGKYYSEKKFLNRSIGMYERFFAAGGTAGELGTVSVPLEIVYDKLGSVTVPEYWTVSEVRSSTASSGGQSSYSWNAYSVYGISYSFVHFRKSGSRVWNIPSLQTSAQSMFEKAYDTKYYSRSQLYGHIPRSAGDFSFSQIMNGAIEKNTSLDGPVMYGFADNKTSRRKGAFFVLIEGYTLKYSIEAMNDSFTIHQINYPYFDSAEDTFARTEISSFLDSLLK